MRKTNSPNPELNSLIGDLKKLSLDKKAPLWKRIAKDLSKPTRQRRTVNISKINRVVKSKETIIVPGKVLGTGDLTQDITIAAFKFSESAKQKIKNPLSIRELMKKHPDGKGIRIIG